MAIQTGVVKLLNKTFAKSSAQETVDFLFNIQKMSKDKGKTKRQFAVEPGLRKKGYGKDRVLTGDIERDTWSLEKYGVLFDDIATLPLNPIKGKTTQQVVSKARDSFNKSNPSGKYERAPTKFYAEQTNPMMNLILRKKIKETIDATEGKPVITDVRRAVEEFLEKNKLPKLAKNKPKDANKIINKEVAELENVELLIPFQKGRSLTKAERDAVYGEDFVAQTKEEAAAKRITAGLSESSVGTGVEEKVAALKSFKDPDTEELVNVYDEMVEVANRHPEMGHAQDSKTIQSPIGFRDGKSKKVVEELQKHKEFAKLFDADGLLKKEIPTTKQRNINMIRFERQIREIYKNIGDANKMGDTTQLKNLSTQLDDIVNKMKTEQTYIYVKLPDNNPNNLLGWKIKKLGYDPSEAIPNYIGSSKKAQFDLEVADRARSIKELKYKDGGRVGMSVGGLTGSKGGIGVDDRLSKVGTLESMLAGVGAGLIDIPKGAFTLGAALLDLGFGTSNAAKVEKYFDDLTTFDEKAEQTFAGDLTRIMVNLGVPGGFAFKKGADLATKAMLAKKNGNYFRLTDPKLAERFNTSLNAKGRLFATLGGAGAAGVSDMIFVGDPEHVGTIGDMFGGPTQLKPNDEKNAAREVANRIKFGLDSSLLIGAVGGTGSSIKSLIRRSNELQTNNDAIDKFLSYLRPRGKKTQEFFDIERENLGLRRSDINRAEEVSRKLDKHIDAIFPFVKNPFNKLGNDGRREFMQKLNDTLLSGDYKISAETGKTEFGLMDKNKVKEITEMMVKKGGSEKDVKGVIEQFYNIRSGWQLMFDDLGTAMGKDALTEFAPLFGKKFKDYLGSTYEIFRNKSVIPMLNYKPTEQAVKKMIKLFKESASEKGVNLGDEQAEYYVNELLASARPPRAIATSAEKTSGVYFNAPDFFINKTTLADIEMPPKTLPLESLTDDAKKVVDELLGKVEDPLQTILTGTNKLSLVTRRNQLFQTLNKSNQEILEKRAAFIKENPGKEIPAALRGMFRETELEAINDLGKNIKKIELDPSRTEEAGIVNPLDGLYAERGVAEAIEETAMIAKDKSSLFQLYQSTLLYPKATSQMAKTILSPITHARNFISAGAFAAANGLIPGLTVSFDDTGRAFKEAYGALQIPGARIDNTRYRELLRLGVVNNNVRLGDLQKLLKDVNFGETFNSNVALRNMMRPLSKAKKWTEDMYTAEDDFWKITTFALERSRLKDTYDKYGVKYTNELLDNEAAKIVKNNVPNYDYVNDFVKDLRQLPFGNFVSFPAEIYRTSFNIMNQSWKEIFTPHTLDDGRIVYPLRNIGLKRMFGFASTVVGVPYGTVEAFKAIHDVTEEEMSALRRFVPDWSKNSTLVPIRGEDGNLKYIDFSHANAYDTMIRPITTMINGVQKGLEEDQVFKNVFLSMIDATKETASPFVSESIWTEALFDVSPIFGRGGRTSEGRRLWTDETPWGDAFVAGIKHLGATVVPGSLPAMGRMRDALTETVDEYGRSYEFGDELLGVAGMRVVEVDPARSMKFKIADFRTGINNSRREFTGPLLKGGPITPEQVVDQYQKANESLFRVQQKMFKDYYAARTLGVSDRALENTFQDRVSNKQVRAIQTGRFTPFIPSENIEQAFADNARAIGQPDAFQSALSQIRRLIRNYQKLTLGNTFPIIDNPFRMPVTQNITGPLSQITGTPLDNTSLSQPLIGNQQVATAQRGQQVFGSNDPIFGVG
tara:strand:- start:191 stop:5380 length:5190 start_codon:yes stop_codon:yes gene_type:complete